MAAAVADVGTEKVGTCDEDDLGDFVVLLKNSRSLSSHERIQELLVELP